MFSTGVLRRPWAVALVMLVVSVGSAQAQTKPSVATAAEELSRSTEALARVVSPAVVEIFTTSYVPAEASLPRTADLVTTQRASGSGVIVDPDGYIVTNAHVVTGAQRLRVDIPLPAFGNSILSARSRTVNASIVGIDLENGPRDNQGRRAESCCLAIRRFRRSARRSTRHGVWQPARARQLGVARCRERDCAPARARVCVAP